MHRHLAGNPVGIGCDSGPNRIEFARADRFESNRVAGAEQSRARPAGIEQANGRRADQVPSARAFHRIDCGHCRRDSDRAGRHAGSRIGAPRQDQRSGKISHVRISGREAQHVNVEACPAMEPDDFVGGKAGTVCHFGEVGGVARRVAGRNPPQFRWLRFAATYRSVFRSPGIRLALSVARGS